MIYIHISSIVSYKISKKIFLLFSLNFFIIKLQKRKSFAWIKIL